MARRSQRIQSHTNLFFFYTFCYLNGIVHFDGKLSDNIYKSAIQKTTAEVPFCKSHFPFCLLCTNLNCLVMKLSRSSVRIVFFFSNTIFCSQFRIIITRRKSSCVNTRGIPTVAYQVLPRWGPPPRSGYPPWARSDGGRGYPRWGTPPAGPGWGTPPLVWTDRRTDASQNITFPSYYVRGR